MAFLRSVQGWLQVFSLTTSVLAYDLHSTTESCSVGNSAALACSLLQQSYPNITYFSNSTAYIDDNTDFWSQASALGPACSFNPANAQQVAAALQILKATNTPFAVKGGGHMPIGDSNNINSTGVLISSAGLTQLSVNEEGGTMSTGPGNHWVDVYDFLEPYGLTMVGGRLGVVGIPGFVLGGGISFFSYEYGWCASNVKSFEVVLADGKVVNASTTGEYTDLYWALRGGGNSFGIVTSIEFKTYPFASVMVGETVYGTTNNTDIGTQFLDSIYAYALEGSKDPKSALTPTVTYYNGAYSYSAYRFYNGNETAPQAFVNLTDPVLPVSSDTWSYRSMANWSAEGDIPFAEAYGHRTRFHVSSFPVNRQGMQLVNDTIFAAAHAANISSLITTLAYMTITEQYLTAGKGIYNFTDPMGVDPTKAPYIWVEQSMLWDDEADDAAVDAFVVSANAQLEEQFKAAGIATSPYLYLNDADETQPVFQGYPDANVQRLKQIRSKYDPERVFTDLMPGGWKIADIANGYNSTEAGNASCSA